MAAQAEIDLRLRMREVQQYAKEILNDADFDSITQSRDSQAFRQAMEKLHQSSATGAARRLPAFSRSTTLSVGSLTDRVTAIYSSLGESAGMVWGMLSLAIEIAAKSDAILELLLQSFDGVSHSVGLFSDCVGDYHAQPLMMPIMDHSTEILHSLCMFLTDTIKFLRNHTPAKLARLYWEHGVDSRAANLCRDLEKRTARIKERATAFYQNMLSGPLLEQGSSQPQLVRQLENLRSAQQTDVPTREPQQSDTKVPFHFIPYPENTAFFGRKTELGFIRQCLDPHKSHPTHRALAIWGSGGIGKTQLALAYASEKIRQNTSVVLWINSETQLMLYQSYTEIAAGLRLQGNARNDGATTAYLVNKWLQTTDLEWLLVFDNVERLTLVKEFWPMASNGSVLMTSRCELIDPLLQSFEVPVFTDKEGGDLLLQTIGRLNYGSNETSAARLFAHQLGGLGLALTVMAMEIRRRQTTIEDFLPFYDEYRSLLHQEDSSDLKPFYQHSLKTAWNIPFSSLTEQETIIFEIFCLLAPDDIPIEILKASDPAQDSLRFCDNKWLFEKALHGLINSSLIKKNPATNMVNVHRVIQQEYRNTMTEARKGAAFVLVSSLLHASFPRLVNGVSLRNAWAACQRLINHVLAVSHLYLDFELEKQPALTLDPFVETLAAAGWFLHESGTPTECLRLMETAYKACPDKKSLIYATLLNNAAVVEEKRSHSDEAIDLFGKCREIRESQLPSDHEELANIYNNLSMALMSKQRYSEAEKLLYEALAIDLTKPSSDQAKILHTRYLNLGHLYALMGHYQESREQIARAKDYVVAYFGENSYYIATSQRQIGYIYYKEGQLTEARQAYSEAYAILTKIYKVHPTISATTYMLGCVDLSDSKTEDAIGWLRQTLLLAEYNAIGRGDEGEVARAARKLAAALTADGKQAEAQSLHRKADKIRKELQGSDYDRIPETDDSYDLFVAAQYRT